MHAQAAAVRTSAAALALLGLLLGCSAQTDRGPAGRPVPAPAPAGAGTVGAAATTTPAAELRAGITWLLVERTHLLAAVRRAVVAPPPDEGASLRAVLGRLDETAVELVDTVDGRPGALRAALQAETEAALRSGDVTAPLSGARDRTVEVLQDLVPALRTADLREALDAGTAALADPDAPTADPFAAGIAAGVLANALAAERSLGSTETSAVVLRSDLTALLVARDQLVGDAATTGLLDRVAVRLAAQLAPEAQQPGVLAALRSGHAALVGAAQARRSGDAALADRARQALAAADRDLAARVAAAVPALPADLVLRELDPARGPLLAAVGARAGGDADAARLSARSSRMAVVTAAVLAAGLAEQRRLR